MGIFSEVGLTWRGEEYTVPSDKVMGLIEVVEDVITIEELTSSRGVKRAAISKAFAVALRYAGCKGVAQQEVYTTLFDADKSADIQNIITSLLMMMIPPEHLQEQQPPKPKARAKKSAKG